MPTDDRTCRYVEVDTCHLLFIVRDAAAAVLRWCSADLRIAEPALRYFRPATMREVTGRVPGLFAHVPRLAGRSSRQDWAIWVRSDLPLREQHLTVAHECAHLVLSSLSPQVERDAEAYAVAAVDALSTGLKPGCVAAAMRSKSAPAPSAAPLAAAGRSGSPTTYTRQPSPSKAAYVPGRGQPLDPAALAKRYGVPMRSDGRLDLSAYFRQRQSIETARLEWR